MTATEFALLCGLCLIDPAIAVENEKIAEALRDRRGDDVILELLQTEF